MILIHAYLYDSTNEENGYRGDDLSGYIASGFENTEKANEEVDVSEMTLNGYPSAEEFAPETKFIIDIEQGDSVVTLHRVCESDVVTKQIMSEEYYVHAISLAEPSVIAQKRAVDNISISYKLKDVNLETKSSYDLGRPLSINNDSNPFSPESNFTFSAEISGGLVRTTICAGKYFSWEQGSPNMETIDGQTTAYYYKSFSSFETDDSDHYAKFIIPKPAIMWGDKNAKTFSKIGYASVSWRVVESKNGEKLSEYSGEFVSNSALNSSGKAEFPYIEMGIGVDSYELRNRWLYETADTRNGNAPRLFFKKYTDSSGISFDGASPLETPQIKVHSDCKYEVTARIKEFSDNLPEGCVPEGFAYGVYPATVLVESTEVYFTRSLSSGQMYTRFKSSACRTNNTLANASMHTYTSSEITTLIRSGNPYSAYDMLVKAILNSGWYKKKGGVPVYALEDENCECPIYIDETIVSELSSTQVNETFFQQKNLWETMLEAGYYIHAIPELLFGKDDKFVLTYKKIGNTEQRESLSTRYSVMNHRGLEDYVSAVNSYVENLVQLGGMRTEFVAPKTLSEQFLVYNDEVAIKTSGNIIELLRISVICGENKYSSIGISSGDTADMTEYVYEKSIYDLLSVNYLDVPNKGIALYYNLGENSILGGQYQLPRSSYDEFADYAIKKVIYCAYKGYHPEAGQESNREWEEICVNDFVFEISYRTKDATLVQHARPDIRHYLVSSKYDEEPRHEQFNNQEEVYVDSDAFGQNVFGRLVRTGNSNYSITEWAFNISDLKHKAELYRINGDLYFVFSVKNTFYADHIISSVEFSKDYNQLTPVVGIPSEPRFFEISERNAIKRERIISDYILCSTTPFDIDFEFSEGYSSDYSHIRGIVFGEQIALLDSLPGEGGIETEFSNRNDGRDSSAGDYYYISTPSTLYKATKTASGWETDAVTGVGGTEFAKYAITTFRGDKDSANLDEVYGTPSHFKDVITPVNAYSCGLTLVYEWDMADNFSAGDEVTEAGYTEGVETADNSYRVLRAVRYCDEYGKSALFDFFLLRSIGEVTADQVRAFPEFTNASGNLVDTRRRVRTVLGNWITDTDPPIDKLDIVASNIRGGELVSGRDETGEVLVKDCRESVSFNYNIKLITGTDTIITSPYFFSANKGNLRLVFLADEVSKISNGWIDSASIVKTNLPLFNDIELCQSWEENGYGKTVPSMFYINMRGYYENISEDYFFEDVPSVSVRRVRAYAIVIVDDENTLPPKMKFVIARNIPETDTTPISALKSLYFGTPIKERIFTNRQ